MAGVNCILKSAGRGFICEACGEFYRRNLKANCGKQEKPKPRACPECAKVLNKADRRAILRDEGRIWWWCPDCHKAIEPCKKCNAGKPK